MAGVGGYQAPANPAIVSGAGAASARTDGNPGATLEQANQYAASQAQDNAPSFDLAPGNPAAGITGGDDISMLLSQMVPSTTGTQRPNENIMVGLDNYMTDNQYDPNAEAKRLERAKLLAMLESTPEQGRSKSTNAMILRLRAEV